MKILALETSAKSVSVAVTEDGVLLAQSYQNRGLTHSVTLMPLLDAMLQSAGLTLDDIGLVAVTHGPGSFTGLRIGVSAAKGLAWAKGLPCCGVSSLEAMAYGVGDFNGLIVGAMDARRQQVYNGCFLGTEDGMVRLSEDRAIGLDELTEEVKKSGNPQILVGDGAELCYNAFRAAGIPARLAPPHLLRQTAWGVARAALELARQGKLVPAGQMTPQYHRLSQAERERLERMKNQTNE